MNKAHTILFLSLFVVLQSSTVFASRFWLTNGTKISPKVINEQLISSPNSLKKKGDHANGWTLAFYVDGVTLMSRSPKASSDDEQFDQAVKSAADNRASLIIGHLSEAAPDCADSVEPLHRFRDGKSWFFGHSGVIGKDLLTKLIGEDYLKEHPPLLCGGNPPASWTESELYFIYLFKYIEQAADVRKGLELALKDAALAQAGGQPGEWNFYLTDGRDLWVFRNGASIYYTYNEKEQMPIIASDMPSRSKSKWQEIPQDTLTLVEPSKQPTFYALGK